MHLENEIIFLLKSERRIAHDTNYSPTEVQDVSCPLQEKQTQSRTQCKSSRWQSVRKNVILQDSVGLALTVVWLTRNVSIPSHTNGV